LPRLRIKLKKRVFGGLGRVEGELEIEAETLEDLFKILEKAHWKIK